jgi:GT2 family glycosyltransferase
MAVVVTYNAPEAVAQCVAAVAAQTRSVAEILVVDNASETPVGGSSDRQPPVHVLRLPENTGPAGGYAAGLRAFLDTDFSWVWLLDDDCTPRPDTLAAQLRRATEAPVPTTVLATMVDRDTGSVVNTHGWCGVLVPREIVAAVGVPIEGLFWWAEDTEYIQWRIPRAGFALERDDAVVEVSLRRAERSKPAWKFYYEARNQVFYRLRVQRQPETGLRQRHLKMRVRTWRAARTVTKLAGRAVLREPEGRVRKLGMVLRGAADGLRGRLGRTVRPGAADRPLVGAPGERSGGRVESEEALDPDEA